MFNKPASKITTTKETKKFFGKKKPEPVVPAVKTKKEIIKDVALETGVQYLTTAGLVLLFGAAREVYEAVKDKRAAKKAPFNDAE